MQHARTFRDCFKVRFYTDECASLKMPLKVKNIFRQNQLTAISRAAFIEDAHPLFLLRAEEPLSHSLVLVGPRSGRGEGPRGWAAPGRVGRPQGRH